jgi:hypothetical protein
MPQDGLILYTCGRLLQRLILLDFIITLPAKLTADNDKLEVLNHDSWIISMASSYAFTCMEEKESADAWATIGQGHGVPLAIGTQLRTEFEEALKHGYIVQRTRATNPAGTS